MHVDKILAAEFASNILKLRQDHGPELCKIPTVLCFWIVGYASPSDKCIYKRKANQNVLPFFHFSLVPFRPHCCASDECV